MPKKKPIPSPYEDEAIYVKPENRMSEKRAKEFEKMVKNSEGKSIFTIEEGVTMPLYMSIIDVKLGEDYINIASTIQHHIKENEISVICRTSNQHGDKKVMPETERKPYNKKNYEFLKDLIQGIPQMITRESNGLVEIVSDNHLEFPEKATGTQIVRQMEASNLFSFAQLNKKEKED